MASLSLDQVTPRALAGFYRLLGVSLIARVATDFSAGIYRVHTGELFPWRHLPIVPLYSPTVLLLEWLLLSGSGIALVLVTRVRVALYVALVATAMGLSQRYSNQSALTLIVLCCCALKPLTPDEIATGVDHPHLDLVRYQLLIVYVFSALNKIGAGFLSGATLGSLVGLPLPVARAVSWSVVLIEIALPLLLVLRKQRVAWIGVVVMHVAFSALMPGLVPFGLLMVAMATLWLGPRRSNRPAV